MTPHQNESKYVYTRFETSPHKWLKLFATKGLNSRLNITDESYNPLHNFKSRAFSKFLNCKVR